MVRRLLLLELMEFQAFLLLKSLKKTFSLNVWVAFSLPQCRLASQMLVFKYLKVADRTQERLLLFRPLLRG
ncbi:hypothetical protein PF005_g3130 [Phytophthora fragariae]|uniref:Uncharacterized protein n=2 Tax=Phytophthora TaxID=4783 RepID=A0A6A3Z6I0_9STRA|nr:hypothetical protein PF003_g39151 [Phytophthora fragariae]KAE9016526.1 hypothetical protein PR002_g13633 [Phytophthora rubi]KAE8938912.1 hypothetical protein PF009_g11231 [Phytophthora fragariae]KAE9017429.1 hypothetical protein PF011_g6698 [Phytophthora fragariae]KAE9120345.1 hypothetical protein PF007_g8196 [Phytophthora fragariae]